MTDVSTAVAHIADTGTVLVLTITDQDDAVVSLVGATVKQILMKKPDGVVLTKAASFTTDGSDGKIQWTTLVTDLDVPGLWILQGNVQLASGAWHTTYGALMVQANLA